MKLKLITLFLSLCVVTSTLSAQILQKVVGDGKYIAKNFKVDHFTEVEMSDVFNVVYTQDSNKANDIRIEAESNVMEMIQVKVKKGRLKLSMKKALSSDYGIIMVYIASEKLYEVRNSGHGVFELDGKLTTSDLTLSVTSNGQIKMERITADKIVAGIVSPQGDILLGGTSKEANYKIKVGGEIRADKLKANNVNCTILGSGSVGCYALNRLNANFWGTGKVYFRGNPSITSGGIGKGDVIPIKD